MKVLFCTDGSKISYNSIHNFSNWFSDFSVDILCAADWSFLPDSISVEDSEFAVKCTNSTDSILKYSQSLLEESGIQVDNTIRMCGSTVDCIIETSEKQNYAFIVLGSNGKKGLQKWLGSVSQEIATVSKISTYISKERNLGHKILFAVDSSDNSRFMVKEAINLLNLTNKEIFLTTVYEVPDYLFLEGNIDNDWINEVDKKQEISSKMLLSEYEKIFSEQGILINNKNILRGNPANEIIRYTIKEDIDLVVCGVRNKTFLSKFLLNSVSKRILENTKSDVMIIQPRNRK